MTLPDRYRRTALAKAWPLLERLVGTLCLMAGLSNAGGSDGTAGRQLAAPLRRNLLRLLRPAEALARRLIVLIAREEAAEARTAACPGQKSRHAGFCSQPPSACFSLYEPIAPLAPAQPTRMPDRLRPPAGSLGPRILDLSGDYPAETLAPVPELPPRPDRVLARIRGLQACLAAPSRYARRLARAMARRLASVVFRRANPLRPGLAPGARSAHTPPEVREMLSLLSTETKARPG